MQIKKAAQLAFELETLKVFLVHGENQPADELRIKRKHY
jgi:hypothetical protein